jgi:hypothetical protein
MPLRCVFYSEFHYITGPMLVHCVPQDLRLIEAFDQIHEYIIPKEQLCHRIIITQMKSIKIVGFPVCMESNKYQRNKLLFNLAFAFDVDDDPTPYEPVCRKVAKYMRELEVF